MKQKYLFIFSFILGFSMNACGQEAAISGTVKLDSNWAKKIYVSRITDFNLMFTASDKLIIAEAGIDSNGNYTTGLPHTQEETLYRMHFIRKGDPVSTLIIGSKDENYVFFVASDSDHIYSPAPDSNRITQQSNIRGSKANEELNLLFELINNDTISREAYKNALIDMAARSVSESVALLAIHYTFGLNSKQKARISNILKRFNKDNPYGSRIFKEYRVSYNWIVFLFAGLILLLVILQFGSRVYRERKNAKIVHALSQRETHVVRLILADKSNKEIANELNIELSTVKTHVNNIFAKLKIDNRKKLLKYKSLFSDTVQK